MLQIEGPANCSCYVRCKVKLEQASKKFPEIHLAVRGHEVCGCTQNKHVPIFFNFVGFLTKNKKWAHN